MPPSGASESKAAKSVSREFRNLFAGAKARDVTRFDPGQHGGGLACGRVSGPDGDRTLCAWRDAVNLVGVREVYETGLTTIARTTVALRDAAGSRPALRARLFCEPGSTPIAPSKGWSTQSRWTATSAAALACARYSYARGARRRAASTASTSAISSVTWRGRGPRVSGLPHPRRSSRRAGGRAAAGAARPAGRPGNSAALIGYRVHHLSSLGWISSRGLV